VRTTGTAKEVVSSYIKESRSWTSSNLLDFPRRDPATEARFSSVEILDEHDQDSHELAMGSDLVVRLGIVADRLIRTPCVAVTIVTPHNQRIFYCGNRDAGYDLPPMEGQHTLTCRMKALNLLPGRYYIDLLLHDMAFKEYDVVPSATYFDVNESDILGSGIPIRQEHGLVYYRSDWEWQTAEKPEPSLALCL
jgi:hypothetical protein